MKALQDLEDRISFPAKAGNVGRYFFALGNFFLISCKCFTPLPSYSSYIPERPFLPPLSPTTGSLLFLCPREPVLNYASQTWRKDGLAVFWICHFSGVFSIWSTLGAETLCFRRLNSDLFFSFAKTICHTLKTAMGWGLAWPLVQTYTVLAVMDRTLEFLLKNEFCSFLRTLSFCSLKGCVYTESNKGRICSLYRQALEVLQVKFLNSTIKQIKQVSS